MRRTILVAVLAAVVGALVAVPIAVYASHQFTDVPNTNPFHADIDWLADVGVTKGCSPTEYCPKDNVTREQMAAFMRRLSGNDPNVAPSVNANELGGFSATELGPRAVVIATVDIPDLRVGQTTYKLEASSRQLIAPAEGFVVLSGGVNSISSTNDPYTCHLLVAGVGEPTGSRRWSTVEGASHPQGCQTSGAVTVPAGAHTISLVIENVDSNTDLQGASVWAIWVPFDGNGNIPSFNP